MTQNLPTTVRTLANAIRDSRPGQDPIKTDLETSDRVLRRVTDGIYREPWAALREILSNAYDADATEVVIDTDAPRFAEIRIRDNGNGFNADSLASMIKSIGGSPKRTDLGAALGVTNPTDPDRSPRGRKLIGKLGIGLFAVSQLTHEFQIVTKVKNEDTRSVADVLLFRYAENSKSGREFQTGSVRLWKVPARDKRSHGTEIVLRSLLPRTKAEFSSADLWEMALSPDIPEGKERPMIPRNHIGLTHPDSAEFKFEPCTPWGDRTDPDSRFRILAETVFERAKEPGVRPSLENTFDNYFRFMWFLSLAAPLDYLDGHPFDLTNSANLRVFTVANVKYGRAEELKLKPSQTIRDALALKSPERGSNLQFKVLFDGVSLKRPIRFTGHPKTSHAIDQPLLFIGKDRPDLSKYPEAVRGGNLEFEGYLLWTPRVVPVEHNGVLVRVNDAGGALFDESFMKYQVSEQSRIRQISSEIFVTEGLDAALNIDRESFNVAHPHYQYLALWVHSAFRQFATRHKDLGKSAREKRLLVAHTRARRSLERVVADIVEEWTDGDQQPVRVEFTDNGSKGANKETLTYSLSKVFKSYGLGPRLTKKKATEFTHDRATMLGVAQVLAAAGVFDRMGHERQEELLADLATVIFQRRAE